MNAAEPEILPLVPHAAPSIKFPNGRTDVANAKRLVAKHGHNIRWCDPWEKWLIWDGRRWAIDDTRRIEAMAKSIAEQVWGGVGKAVDGADERTSRAIYSFAKATASANGIRSMLALAKSEEGVPILPDKLDTNSWLLNCPNGIVDLRTGDLLKHCRERYITKLCDVQFDQAATCPRWMQFLNEVFAGNEGLIQFAQRAAGYSLTGETNERCFFFLFGSGRNGKSTLVSTLQKLMGEYATELTTEFLMVGNGQQHPTETCDLFGVRLAVATETEDGRRFAESHLKKMTGGEDVMKGRRMREDHWTFRATHKIWMSGNHKPRITGTDDAIWDRVRLIPFDVRFADPDKLLAEKLRAELPGILRWAVEGCLAWQAHGLGEPEAVAAAVACYRAESDVLGQFLADRCSLHDGAEVGATAIHKAYEDWCEAIGERPVNQTRFGRQLAERGFAKGRFSHGADKGKACWRGIELAASEG